MNETALRKRVKAMPYWYHKIELPYGLVTPGWAPINPSQYKIPMDLTGRRVLDIGAWDGYWTFEALKRGAREVVAIDDFSDYLGDLPPEARQKWATFDLCREALGYSEAICKRIELSIYDISKEELGLFDTVFFFGTIYHLRYPLLALDRIASVCTHEIYIESAILDDYSPYRGGLGQGYSNQMVMEFYPGDQYGGNESNWWVPTLHCLLGMACAAGFKNGKGWKLAENPQELPLCRGFVYGVKGPSQTQTI
jgi:tRNA (mo5U34)-methyltransferase